MSTRPSRRTGGCACLGAAEPTPRRRRGLRRWRRARRGDMSVLAFVESNTTGTGALLVERARMLGLRSVLLTRDPGRYPFAAAGEVEVVEVETMDRGLVVTRCRALAAEEPLAGVTSSSDYFIETAAAAARTLALPAPDPDAIR